MSGKKDAETQQDRCSAQRHLWRRRDIGGVVHMACRCCGAVHPTDLREFLETTS